MVLVILMFHYRFHVQVLNYMFILWCYFLVMYNFLNYSFWCCSCVPLSLVCNYYWSCSYCCWSIYNEHCCKSCNFVYITTFHLWRLHSWMFWGSQCEKCGAPTSWGCQFIIPIYFTHLASHVTPWNFLFPLYCYIFST